jgi:hypothetical protein
MSQVLKKDSKVLADILIDYRNNHKRNNRRLLANIEKALLMFDDVRYCFSGKISLFTGMGTTEFIVNSIKVDDFDDVEMLKFATMATRRAYIYHGFNEFD